MVITFFTGIGCNYQRLAILQYCAYNHVSVFWMETSNFKVRIVRSGIVSKTCAHRIGNELTHSHTPL